MFTDTTTERAATNIFEPFRLSTPSELEAALAAEARTGLKAREIFRPARCKEPPLFPDDLSMRCQLGVLRVEKRSHSRNAIRSALEPVDVVIFELKATGRNWAEATNNARLKGFRV
jgi:hypothetical protein